MLQLLDDWLEENQLMVRFLQHAFCFGLAFSYFVTWVSLNVVEIGLWVRIATEGIILLWL